MSREVTPHNVDNVIMYLYYMHFSCGCGDSQIYLMLCFNPFTILLFLNLDLDFALLSKALLSLKPMLSDVDALSFNQRLTNYSVCIDRSAFYSQVASQIS